MQILKEMKHELSEWLERLNYFDICFTLNNEQKTFPNFKSSNDNVFNYKKDNQK